MAHRRPNRARTRHSAKHHGTRLSTYRRRLSLEPLEDRRLLAVVMVTTALDTVDFSDGQTSLREAIFATNLVDGPDTIRFDFGHDGPATILLTQGELAITDDLTIEGTGADLLTIDASGNDPTPDINDGKGSRIFRVDNGDIRTLIHVTISNLTVTGGDSASEGGAIRSTENLDVVESHIRNNATSTSGGGIFSQSYVESRSAITIIRSVVTENIAAGGGTSNFYYGGGGIHSRGGDAAIVDSMITQNSARYSGGGVEKLNGTLVITGSTIAENSARFFGGGIRSYGLTTIGNSKISGNSAYSGGGVYAHGFGHLEVAASEITDNSTAHGGGGIQGNHINLKVVASLISNNDATKGGGIYFTSDGSNKRVGSVVNSTISGNSAIGGGGGIYHSLGRLNIEFSTITNNSAPDGWGSGVAAVTSSPTHMEFHSSIIAGNNGSDVDIVDGELKVFQSNGYNLVGSGTAASKFNGDGDQVEIVHPLLGPLADNGGRPCRTTPSKQA